MEKGWYEILNYSPFTEPLLMQLSTSFSVMFLKSQSKSQFHIWAAKLDDKKWLKRDGLYVIYWRNYRNSRNNKIPSQHGENIETSHFKG